MNIQLDPSLAEFAIRRYGQLAERSKSKSPRTAQFRFTQHRVAYAPSRSVSAIPNAVVLSGEWFVLAGEHALCDAYNQTPFPPLSAYHLGVAPPNGINLIHPSPVNLSVPRAFLLAGCPNYCHWLMDYLPRVALWSGDLPLLINGPLGQFQIESLELIGVGRDRLIELDYPNAYNVEVLFYPSVNSAWCTGHLPFRPEVVEWTRLQFSSLMAVTAQNQRRIFITRAGAPDAVGRRLINADEITRIAERHGFEIVACEAMSFAEQVRLFSQAAVVAGPHGAGFTNLVFAPKGTRVIELIGPRYGRDVSRGPLAFRHLAGIMNMDFIRLIGQSDERIPVENNHLPNEAFTIDPAAFSQALDRLP